MKFKHSFILISQIFIIMFVFNIFATKPNIIINRPDFDLVLVSKNGQVQSLKIDIKQGVDSDAVALMVKQAIQSFSIPTTITYQTKITIDNNCNDPQKIIDALNDSFRGTGLIAAKNDGIIVIRKPEIFGPVVPCGMRPSNIFVQ